MKSNEIPFINTQLKIVRVLLNGEKIYQREIAKKIKRKESTMSRALDYLVKDKVVCKELLKTKCHGRKNEGVYSVKKCWLSYEIDNGKNVLNFIKNLPEALLNDKSLFSDLQKSSKIKYSLRQNFPFFKDVLTEGVDDLKTICMVRCELSQTFLKNYLTCESYLESFLELYRDINKNNDDCKKPTSDTIEQIYDVMFLHAVITDKLNGNLNPNAIDEIRQSPYIHNTLMIPYGYPMKVKKSELDEWLKKGKT